jgi:hypothetical protein
MGNRRGEVMTKAERVLATIREHQLKAELFKTPFNLIGQRVENPKHFTPRPTYKQEPLFASEKGER